MALYASRDGLELIEICFLVTWWGGAGRGGRELSRDCPGGLGTHLKMSDPWATFHVYLFLTTMRRFKAVKNVELFNAGASGFCS